MATVRDEIYWNTFYSNNSTKQECSDFCLFVLDFFKNYTNLVRVLDCGCGNGRDSYTLADKYQVEAVDNCGFLSNNESNVNFSVNDFVTMNKTNYDVIYSRFTFHSISDEQQVIFLDSIQSNTYLAIETRSKEGEQDDVYHGKTHYRNYTGLHYLQDILKSKNYEVLYIKEDKNMAVYKNENPYCIRVICKKL